MKKAKISLAVAGICLALAMVCSSAQAASPVISLDPGDTLTREFILGDEIDFSKLGPAKLFLVIGTGDNETLLGDLTISVTSSVVAEEFGTDIDYTVQGVAIGLDTKPAFKLGKPTVFAPVTTVPNAAKKVIKLNSAYGFALVVIYISNFDGDTYGNPVKFSATFGMSVGVAQ
ncbi:MAG: hypothetical protein JW832_16995 [Deltaproteobacteria bacterium]|nr:hypothetical protein [Deltaproteobacteria bacterium]